MSEPVHIQITPLADGNWGWVAWPDQDAADNACGYDGIEPSLAEAWTAVARSVGIKATALATADRRVADMREAAARWHEEQRKTLMNEVYDSSTPKALRESFCAEAAAHTKSAVAIRALPLPDAPEPQGWRPIATAPRDGTPIVAGLIVHHQRFDGSHWGEWQQHVIWFDDERGEIDLDCECGWDWDDFTHFMPLPPPPPARTAQGEAGEVQNG